MAVEFIIRRRGGTVEGIYSDAVPYRALAERLGGTLKTTRASQVEPTEDGRWTADMALRGGPVLGPFETHGEAIVAETGWIRAHVLGIGAAA